MIINFCCFNWGSRYPSTYVDKLYNKIKKNTSYSFELYCFTDNKAINIKSDVKVINFDLSQFPEEMVQSGCWPKIVMFKPNVFPTDNVTIFLDLDIMILGSLDIFIETVLKKRGLYIIREWPPMLIEKLLPLKCRFRRGGNSSVVGFIPSEQNHIFAVYQALGIKANFFGHNDQKYISNIAYKPVFWEDSLVKSFRRHCVWIKPIGLIFKPHKPHKNCRVLIFHGKPDPLEIASDKVGKWGNRSRVGYGAVEWVKAYWSSKKS